MRFSDFYMWPVIRSTLNNMKIKLIQSIIHDPVQENPGHRLKVTEVTWCQSQFYNSFWCNKDRNVGWPPMCLSWPHTSTDIWHRSQRAIDLRSYFEFDILRSNNIYFDWNLKMNDMIPISLNTSPKRKYISRKGFNENYSIIIGAETKSCGRIWRTYCDGQYH